MFQHLQYLSTITMPYMISLTISSGRDGWVKIPSKHKLIRNSPSSRSLLVEETVLVNIQPGWKLKSFQPSSSRSTGSKSIQNNKSNGQSDSFILSILKMLSRPSSYDRLLEINKVNIFKLCIPMCQRILFNFSCSFVTYS